MANTYSRVEQVYYYFAGLDMDTHLRLHPENLSLFVEPLFKREAVGYYSVSSQRRYQADYSEKASLVALKEADKTSQGIVEYEVPTHIEQLNLTEGESMWGNFIRMG